VVGISDLQTFEMKEMFLLTNLYVYSIGTSKQTNCYRLYFHCCCPVHKGPCKSIPVMVNGAASWVCIAVGEENLDYCIILIIMYVCYMHSWLIMTSLQ